MWNIRKIAIKTEQENIPSQPSQSGSYYRLLFYDTLNYLSDSIEFTASPFTQTTSLSMHCRDGSTSDVIAILFVATPNAVGEQRLLCQGWCLFSWHDIFSQGGTLSKNSSYLYEDAIVYTFEVEGDVSGALPSTQLIDVKKHEKTEADYLRQWNEDTKSYLPFHNTLIPAKFPCYKESTVTMPGYMYPLLFSDNPFDESVLRDYSYIATRMLGQITWEELGNASMRQRLTVAFRASQIYVNSCSYSQDVVRVNVQNTVPYFSDLRVSWQRSPHILLRMAEAMNSVTYDHSGDCEEFARGICYFWSALRKYNGNNVQLRALSTAARNYREFLALSAFTDTLYGSHMTCLFLRNDMVPLLNDACDKSLDKFVWLDSVSLVPIHNGGNVFDKYDAQRAILVNEIETIFSKLVVDGREFMPSKKITHWLHTEISSTSVEFSKICVARLFPTQPSHAYQMLLPTNPRTQKYGAMVVDKTAFDNCIPIKREGDAERDSILAKFHLAPRKLSSDAMKEKVLWTLAKKETTHKGGVANIMINPYFYEKLDVKEAITKNLTRLNVAVVKLSQFIFESKSDLPTIFLLQFFFE